MIHQEDSGIDRRRHPRLPAAGPVVLRRVEHGPEEVKGKLLDVSESGFRAAHGCATLRSGEEVAFDYGQAKGWARVVWNRIQSDGRSDAVESGFLIL
jgi:hypothetical protein